MPAAGRRCRQPVRHSVRLSGPRRRRRLLSPDARGPPGAARSSRGPARRRAPPPPGPAPALLPVCPSVRQSTRPLAPPSFCSARPRAVSPLRPLCLSPAAVSLSLPRAASAPPSLPTLGSPRRVPLGPKPPFLNSSIPQDPLRAPHTSGCFSFRTASTPPGLPHILWGPSLPSAPQVPGVLPLSPHSLRVFPFFGVSPIRWDLRDPSGSLSLEPPPKLPSSLASAPPCLPLVCPLSLTLLVLFQASAPPAPPFIWVGIPCFALPASLPPHLSPCSHHTVSLVLKAPF